MSIKIKRTVASSLRAGDKIVVNNKFMTVKSVSFRQARTDKRAISMMTTGRDLQSVVSVDLLNEQGRLVSRDFYDIEVVDVCRELLAPSSI
jgi:hypothetical protein